MRVLKFEEGEAFRRIRAARIARKWPEVREYLERGDLSLTALVVLHPLLTPENRRDWFERAAGKTRRELEMLVAAELPCPPRTDFTRRMPVAGGWSIAVTSPPDAADVLPSPGFTPLASDAAAGSPLSAAAEEDPACELAAGVPAPARVAGSAFWEWQAIVPVSIERVRIGFDAGLTVLRLLERAQQVLRHKYPHGRLEDVFKDALELLLDRKDPQRRLGLKTPEPVKEKAAAALRNDGEAEPRFLRAWKNGRYIPVRVKHEVWRRDDGRCAFRFEDGAICGSRELLEFDHLRPFAVGGRSDNPRNIRLLCRAHNTLTATEIFGDRPEPTDPLSPAA